VTKGTVGFDWSVLGRKKGNAARYTLISSFPRLRPNGRLLLVERAALRAAAGIQHFKKKNWTPAPRLREDRLRGGDEKNWA
jgi:hypothetical protein